MRQLSIVREALRRVCDEGTTRLQNALDDATQELTTADESGSSADVDAAKANLAGAQNALSIIEAMCECVNRLILKVEAFAAPGLACCACCFALLVMNCYLCCPPPQKTIKMCKQNTAEECAKRKVISKFKLLIQQEDSSL